MASNDPDPDLSVLAMIKAAKQRRLRIWLPAIRAGSGADVFTLRLAEALARAGHDPLLQWFDHRYELMPWCLRYVAEPVGIDLVHAGSWQGFAFKRPGVPLVVTEHQYVAHPAFSPYRSFPQMLYHRFFCERWATCSYAAADAVVTVSEYCAAAMRVDIAKPITVIHNWVDTEQYSPARIGFAGVEARQRTARPFKLLFVGNPSRRKGADLLPAIASLLGPGFEIQCIGGLRADFDTARWPANLKRLPRTASVQMPGVYQSVDAALVPTRYEPFGYVALEAMACGLPVLGFNSSGTSEVCLHRETALLAPVDDVQQLVAYARRLAHDGTLSRGLGESGRRRAVECFSENIAIESYLKIYRDALKISHL